MAPGASLEAVVTPAKLGYLAYRCPNLTKAEKMVIGKWLARAAAVCRTTNTCFLCDVVRLACDFMMVSDEDDDIAAYGFALPAQRHGALDSELPSDAEKAWRVLVAGDTRIEVVSLITHQFCREELMARYTIVQAPAHSSDGPASDRLLQLLRRFSADVTFSAHGDRYLHMYVQTLCASWASTVTRSREPAFKAAESQHGTELNDLLRPLIEVSPTEQLDARARDESARCFCLVAGLLLELVPSASVAVDHEVLWVDPRTPALFWLSDFGVPDCYGIAYDDQLHCFNGRGILSAAAEWLFMSAAADPRHSLNTALYVYRPSAVPASSPISKYL